MLVTKRGWETIVFLDESGEMKSRVCTSCLKLKTTSQFTTSSMKTKMGASKYKAKCRSCSSKYVVNFNAKNKENVQKQYARNHNMRARKAGLPANMNVEERIKTLEEQGNKCILTGKTEDISTDHFVSLSWGTGLGNTYQNVIFLNNNINKSKGNRNPFIWIRTQPREIQLRFFNKLVPMLAERNGLTPYEFEEYVNNEYAKYEESKGE